LIHQSSTAEARRRSDPYWIKLR